MHRITITIDDELMSDLNRVIETRGYQNRSEAIRDLTRAGIQQAAEDAGKGRECIGALVYVYDHSARDLAKRLVHTFHDHHEMSTATLHVHLDHQSSMEVTVLKGRTVEVQKVADGVIAERGVRYGRFVVVPVELTSEVHAHASASPHRHSHAHVRRKS
jgi:CopG family transcriptional regulator, nickel-responsive regulator